MGSPQRYMDAMQYLGNASPVPCTGAGGRAGVWHRDLPLRNMLETSCSCFSLCAKLACNHKTDFAQPQLGLNHCTPSHAARIEHFLYSLPSRRKLRTKAPAHLYVFTSKGIYFVNR